MKYFIKLPKGFIGETCSEAENHNAGLNKHHITTAQTFDDPSAVIPNGTAVLQLIYLQTEKIGKLKNQNNGS